MTTPPNPKLRRPFKFPDPSLVRGVAAEMPLCVGCEKEATHWTDGILNDAFRCRACIDTAPGGAFTVCVSIEGACLRCGIVEDLRGHLCFGCGIDPRARTVSMDELVAYCAKRDRPIPPDSSDILIRAFTGALIGAAQALVTPEMIAHATAAVAARPVKRDDGTFDLAAQRAKKRRPPSGPRGGGAA